MAEVDYLRNHIVLFSVDATVTASKNGASAKLEKFMKYYKKLNHTDNKNTINILKVKYTVN